MSSRPVLKGGQETSRALNRRSVLGLLRMKPGLSRAELAGQIGLSRAAITSVVNEMLDEGLLLEGETSAGAPGRRPIPLEIKYDAGFAVGVRVRGSSLQCVLTDLSTQVLETVVVPLEDTSPPGLVEAIATAVELLEAKNTGRGAPIIGIGVGIPGAVQAETGKVLRSFRLGWRNVQLARMLAARVEVPVWVDDDVHAFALAQFLFGAARHSGTSAVLAVGEGVAAASIVEGGVRRGAYGAAGKIGHIRIAPDGPLCECGRRGCLQSLHAEGGMVERWSKGGRAEFLAAIKAGESDALRIARESGEAIGRVAAIYCSTIDPTMLLIGGEATELGAAFLMPLQESLKDTIMADHVEIITDWDEAAWARGAAALATQRLFDFEAVQGALSMN
ncbi:ROK family transcriptional regulator [Pelagovum pacificum]|uniref:ROK family transcriptional regulator n=1 Tax=Pelagovum pacificum TaxID=2588711 RepID=A0A5C5GAF3_9RHOB|nr:ROK family transcriptional regulator [Pelagovum pacificum]QQA41412.1 ROK family transcriptional regulator [Pelagovum pacificum]TNY31785.1 ROK family transcriptional regulator [Pelagovum pacificum]